MLYSHTESGPVRRSGPTHLTTNLEPRSRGLQTRDTSRSHLTCPHCSSLGQPASQPATVKTRGQKPTEQEQKQHWPSSYTCPHKILRCGHVRDDNSRTRAYIATVPCLSIHLPLTLTMRVVIFAAVQHKLIPKRIFVLHFALNCIFHLSTDLPRDWCWIKPEFLRIIKYWKKGLNLIIVIKISTSRFSLFFSLFAFSTVRSLEI